MQDIKDLIISRVKGGTPNNVWTAADFDRDWVDCVAGRILRFGGCTPVSQSDASIVC